MYPGLRGSIGRINKLQIYGLVRNMPSKKLCKILVLRILHQAKSEIKKHAIARAGDGGG